jgi:predicted DNA-binding protein
MEKRTKNFNVRLPEDLDRELKAAAERRERPAGYLVRRFIMAGLRGQRKHRKIAQAGSLQREVA